MSTIAKRQFSFAVVIPCPLRAAAARIRLQCFDDAFHGHHPGTLDQHDVAGQDRLAEVRQDFFHRLAGDRPGTRHPGGPGPGHNVAGETAAGDQQPGTAERDDLSAQLPVQPGRLIAQLAHVAAGASKSQSNCKAARIAVGLEL